VTKTERKKEIDRRVRIAFAATEKLTGDTRLWRKIARLMLTLSTRELSRLRK
jgi:hypothetical protein